VSEQHGRGRERVLDPVERMSEVLFGLIMVLSFTGSISVADAGREDVRAVLVGALGCNLAWGLIDAVMYLLTLVIERRRNRSIGQAVRASRDPAQGRRLIAEALPEPLDELFGEDGLELVRAKLAAMPAPVATRVLRRLDWLRALGVFLLVFLSTFPVVLPFLFVRPLPLAMRVSNGVAIAMLYLVGHSLGRHAGIGPARTGLAMVAIGVVLVALTIALGG
jgi:VIT1/CCC1 family predicted Fe2+/Mn2+ transporter